MRSPKRLIPIVPAEGDIISREQAEAIIERVVKMSKADAISVNVSSSSHEQHSLCRESDFDRGRRRRCERRSDERVSVRRKRRS